MSVQSERQRLLLSMLNEQLTCRLCSGYFIDATTIIKCLHSFCRSCIVKYLEKSKYCPICEVQVHESKPLLNIRPDCTLQDIVYKLVPGCYQNEMRCRREFYANHPDANISNLSPESKGESTDSHIYSQDEHLSLSLEYHNPNVKTESDDEESETKILSLPRRYFRCPAAVTVFHLQKLIRAKHGLSDAHRIDILYKEEPLSSTYTLMDIMYIYHWRRKVPLHLSYRIFESSPKRIKLSEDNAEFKKSLSDSGIGETEGLDEHAPKEWKEVQLKISETGVMSITNITNSDSKKNVRTLDLDSKPDVNALVNTKTPKDLTTQDVKSTNETGKELRIKEEVEKSVTRSATKLSASKAEEKLKSEEKTISTKMDTRASSKEAGKSDNSKSTRSSSQILLNNNSISSERELDEQKQESKSISGSKINALSAKLQFQPKVGQVNNTYSKKGNLKERKATQNLKSSDSKLSKSVPKSDTKTEPTTKAQVSSKTETDKAEQEVKISASPTPESPRSTVATTPSVTVKTSSPVTSASKTTSTVRTTVAKSPVSSTATTSSSQSATQSQAGSCSTSQSKLTLSQNVTTQSTSNVPSSSEKSGIKPSMTITPVGLSESASSGISYTTKDMMNRSSPHPKVSIAISNCKSLLSNSPTSALSSSATPFSTESPVMSIYPASMKNSYSINSSSNVLTITTVVNSTASSNTTKVKSVTSSPITTTTISTSKPESKSDSIPPCPDAIPLSMMKTTMRENQLLSKSANSSDNSGKTPGSKIDDICAKIGENSKEKNKLENRTKADIPGLLEIPKKISPTCEQIIKQIPSIQVPIFKPSSKEPNCTDSYKILPSVCGHSLQSSPTTSQKVSSSEKRVSSFSYKTLRNPPRSWNPTLSKNNYLAIKNQAKELQQQFSCDSKQIPSKPSKIFTMRNTPRYLGNPASGVKPMYNIAAESDKDKEQSTSSSGSSKSHTVSMTKIDPQTLQPMSMVPSPPYSSKDRTYQNVPFSNRDIRSSSSPVSPRNSPVNMLSTSPFIPSPTPNTNPRLIYSTFPPTFPNASRFPHSIMPHSPIGLQPPLSAFHSSLPQVKFYQRSSYVPHSGGFSTVSQLPTVQRIPPTSLSSAPKSPKSTPESKSSSSGLTDSKQDDASKNSKSRKIDPKIFNMLKPEDNVNKQLSKMDLLAKISALSGTDKKASPPPKVVPDKKESEETKCKRKEVTKEDKKDGGKEAKESGEGVKELSRVNGEVTEQSNNSENKKEERKGDKEEEKAIKKDTTNGASQNPNDKLEDDAWRKSTDQVQAKKVEIQRTKAES